MIKTRASIIEEIEKFMGVKFADLTWFADSPENDYMNEEFISVKELKKEISAMRFKSSSPMFDMGANTAIQKVLDLCNSSEQSKEVQK